MKSFLVCMCIALAISVFLGVLKSKDQTARDQALKSQITTLQEKIDVLSLASDPKPAAPDQKVLDTVFIDGVLWGAISQKYIVANNITNVTPELVVKIAVTLKSEMAKQQTANKEPVTPKTEPKKKWFGIW